MRAHIEARPASPVDFTLAPGGARSVFPRGALESMVFTRQIATGGPERFAKPAPLELDLAPPAEVATIALGSFDSASFLTGSRHIPRAPSSQAPAILGHERVQAMFFLPAGAMPAAGWPVIVFGHGGGPDSTLDIRQSGKEPLILSAGGRGLDLDGDGRIGSTEGVATAMRGPLALIGSRDGLRQTVADLMQFVRATRGGGDGDGDGKPDLDGTRIYYAGQSFGGIYGTLLMAVDPLPRAGVLNVPGAPIVEIARQAEMFRPLAILQMRARRPSLRKGEKASTEPLPLWGEPPVTTPAPGALAIQAYLARAEWLQESADPSAFAPYLREAPLMP